MSALPPTPERKTYLAFMRRRGDAIRVSDDIRIVITSIDSSTGTVTLEIHASAPVTTPELDEARRAPSASQARKSLPPPKIPASGRPTLSLKRKDS